MSDKPFDQAQAIATYTDLKRLIDAGEYDELEADDSYPQGGDDVLKDANRLEWNAYRAGLKFVKSESGAYVLEAMTEQEKSDFFQAFLEEEENSAHEFYAGLKQSKPRHTPTPEEQALYTSLLTVQVVGAIQQAYTDGKIADLDTYNHLYRVARKADVHVNKLLKMLEEASAEEARQLRIANGMEQ